MRMFTAAVVGLGVLLTASPAARAQRGMGEETGLARSGAAVDFATLQGNVAEVLTERCQMTTGRAMVGSHLIIETDAGQQYNVHLGPAAAVQNVTGQLGPGDEVRIRAFRTDRMPPEHYVARVLEFDGTTIELRDRNLRPTWALGRGGQFAAREAGSWPGRARRDRPRWQSMPGRGGGGWYGAAGDGWRGRAWGGAGLRDARRGWEDERCWWLSGRPPAQVRSGLRGGLGPVAAGQPTIEQLEQRIRELEAELDALRSQLDAQRQ